MLSSSILRSLSMVIYGVSINGTIELDICLAGLNILFALEFLSALNVMVFHFHLPSLR